MGGEGRGEERSNDEKVVSYCAGYVMSLRSSLKVLILKRDTRCADVASLWYCRFTLPLPLRSALTASLCSYLVCTLGLILSSIILFMSISTQRLESIA